MATTLPSELVQLILLFTDAETYHSARVACSHWRHAASVPFMLKTILEQTPMSLPPIHLAEEEAWNTSFNQIANLNLLGQRNHITKTVSNREIPQGCTTTTALELSSDGKKLVALKGARVMIFDFGNESHHFEFALAQSLYPLWTSVCRALTTGGMGGFAVNQRSAKHQLAVSTNGNLVAVGLGKTIQIYDVSSKESIASPAEYIIGESEAVFLSTPGPNYQEPDGVIESLEFADNDTLLRVVTGKETTANRPNRVQYLGNPSSMTNNQSGLNYWQTNINRIYLDSFALALSFREHDDEKTAFKGLRLLPQTSHQDSQQPAPDSRFFISALQTTDTNEYCIAHVPISTTPQTITIHHRLLSKRSYIGPQAWNNTHPLDQLKLMETITSDKDMISHNLHMAEDRWDHTNLPAATVSCPVMAASDDQKLMVVYEAGAGHSYRFSMGGALYVYSLERYTPVWCGGEETISASALTDDKSTDSLQSWSYLLDIIDVDVDSLRVQKTSSLESSRQGGNGYLNSYTVTAVTEKQVLEWRLN
ncbi:hypothetical protein ASPWEDRAFT_508022 [Aspergillus wentii DTO 134E9]|uniref:F-box domain-containing protein n=1 Tax=Aspergillus wentii DTO 134E9 TaxID=1073089 RepID=A0A1L9RKF6_ASPWE|nr:uncharacterized protein ASPWEDRAFT_508022 [Aspergillus wentii DTO 134E9]KAI9924810.1 hypothetical protein MW887_006666 [Aspergillus wentii]OJJ35419.1 hypothetical protein ASPWEDRAFT_508022 [Aspergillus wentii DTO 134E9]